MQSINNIKSIVSAFILLLISQTVAGQDNIEKFNIAKQFYESGNFNNAIQTLKSIETQIGPNPKLQSLLVKSYYESNDIINAKIEIEKFKITVGSKRTEAIKSILELESSINKLLSEKENQYRQEILNKRMAEAKRVIEIQNNSNRQKQVRLTQEFNKTKENITTNATPEKISLALISANGKEKNELLKNLRKEKKIKKLWEVQFSDKNLTHIVKLTYRELSNEGDLIKLLTKEYGPTYNIQFADFPLFEPRMISSEYISELERNNNYTYISNNKVTQLNKDAATTLKRIDRYDITMSNGKAYNNQNYRFEWRNNKGDLIKDSTVYEKNTYVTFHQPNKRISIEYQNGSIRRYTTDDITTANNATIEKSNSTTYENNKANKSYYSTEYKYNELGHISTYKNEQGHFESYINDYDIYGNIQYQDKYSVNYGYYYDYYYNFYTYFDGYQSPLNQFENRRKKNQAEDKNLSMVVLSDYLNKAIEHFTKKYYAEAKRLLSICLSNDLTNFEYNYWMTQVLVQAGTKQNAQKYIEKILELEPYFPPALDLLGDLNISDYTKTQQSLEYYKQAAEWGLTSKTKRLEAYKYKFKQDKLLNEEEDVNELAISNGVYKQINGKNVYAHIYKDEDRINLQYLSTRDLNSRYGSLTEFKQSRKNPNVYLWKPNSLYRIIVTEHFITYYYPDGYSIFNRQPLN